MPKGQKKSTAQVVSQQSIQSSSQTIRQRKAAFKKDLKNANHVFTWAGGTVFGLLPLLFCCFEKFTYSDQQTIVDAIKIYQDEFMRGGSFLWASISLLVMSYIELLLYGFKTKVRKEQQFGYKVLLVVIFIVLGLAIYIYFRNITTPIQVSKMKLYSWVAFVFFSLVSAFISFKLVKEV